ncbi:helix-turn-helix transcriptional regulator [Streptomyces cyanogenus]|uniref:HTH-type transcriptional regulator n=1 Tax=Streptomyces cyanogenus TaxID=80860 RepID=A0ABX7TK13_STRCY|nr:LuxR family transcriptional regulator [Streptomyces cyanogenus]QTD95908.1 Putative HTH-type transcriptional regulator [Streptomyces cyanogenus]
MEIIERTEQISYLSELLGGSEDHRGQVALIEGPPGTGKSELLRAFAGRAGSAVATLGAVCSPAEQALPFGVLSQLLQGAALSPETQSEMSGPLAAGMAVSSAGPALEDTDPDLAQAFHRICLALLRAASRKPLLISIDDAQYMDDRSRRCLLYLARRLAGARVLLLLTEGGAHLSLAHRLFRGELERLLPFHRLSLAPLSPEGVALMLRRHLGENTSQRLAAEAHRVSGGNPLLLQAVVEDFRQSGGVRAQGYGAAFVDHLHRGDPVLLHAARGLAVLGESARAEEVAGLMHLDTESVTGALRSMTAAGLLADGRFRHSAARLAVLGTLPPGECRELHRGAARMLHERDAPIDRIAHHLVAGDRAAEPWEVDLLLEAAAHLRLDGDLRAAVQCLRLADAAPGLTDRQQLAVRAELTRTEWRLNPSSAARHLGHLTSAARTGRLERQDLPTLVRLLLWHGRESEAAAVLDRIRGAVREDDGGTAREPHDTDTWLAVTYPAHVRGRQLTTVSARQRDSLVTPGADPGLRVIAELGDRLIRGRYSESATHAEQALRDLRLNRRTSWSEETALLALSTLLYADRPDAVLAWCASSPSVAATGQSAVWQAVLAAAHAEAAIRLGDLPEGVDQARTALTRLTPKAWGVAVGLPLGSLVLGATRTGDYDTAAKYLALPVPDALFQSRYGLHYLHARGHHYLATGHAHAALADFLSCGELMRDWGLDLAGLVPWRTSAAEAWLRLDNKDRARRTVQDQLARSATDSPRTRGQCLRLLAAMSPVGQRPQLLAEALDLFEDCRDRYEQAWVLGDLSRAHQALAQRSRARMVLRRARHLAALCAAEPLSQRLVSVPGESPTPGPAPETPDAAPLLTDSEHRVASLAVMGYTNREIADRLYVTPSTVEQHLTRVFRKLGIKRRSDLPADLTFQLAEQRRGRGVPSAVDPTGATA